MARDYKKEYSSFHGKKEQKKLRGQRNTSRAEAVTRGRVKKWDGKEVHHPKPLSLGGSADQNTEIVSAASQRKEGGSLSSTAEKKKATPALDTAGEAPSRPRAAFLWPKDPAVPLIGDMDQFLGIAEKVLQSFGYPDSGWPGDPSEVS